MSAKNIVSFRLIIPLLGEKPDFYTEGSVKYLLFQPLRKNDYLIIIGNRAPILIVPDNNPQLIKQIRNRKNDDFFSTPLSNLKFKPNFINIAEGLSKNPWYLDGLLVKDTNQLEKTEGEIDTPITFKVISQHKIDIRKNGDYKHLLKIEPLDLGIEGMPPITQLLFCFFEPHGGAISEAKELKESKFYNSNILTETAGKTFTMNIKDFQEIKEQNPAENKTKQEKKTMRQGKGLSTNAKIGIAAVLVILRSSVETKKAISAINKQKTRHSIKLPIQLFSIIANHREIAKDLDLYALDEKTEVITPVLGNKELYQISGHLSHYQGYMFPEVSRNNETYYLRPMTCPHHCLIYQQRPRSYRELPFRLCENSLLFRYETSGALKGLERPRWFELADHHTFVNIENLKEELKRNYHFIKTILDNLNFTIERLICSLHDPHNKEKYHPDKEL
ncbi:22151_t:CDS:2 [Entrophospora sp. SA101]|nr:7270_t:CDS:2 [Entrophospora sp. SA101]CAJ0761495.1 22151_t:CDS:2 [Entrophospora sp. SA101]CAJ0882315.1 10647_t:CDS:2 [Entrophospora sp. SA101]